MVIGDIILIDIGDRLELGLPAYHINYKDRIVFMYYSNPPKDPDKEVMNYYFFLEATLPLFFG